MIHYFLFSSIILFSVAASHAEGPIMLHSEQAKIPGMDLNVLVAEANDILFSAAFERAALGISDWDHSGDIEERRSDTAETILKRLRNTQVVSIKPWKPYKGLWPSKANAYADGNTIFINIKKKRTKEQWVITLIHEYCHVVGYRHSSNSLTNETKSVPYYIETLAKQALPSKPR